MAMETTGSTVPRRQLGRYLRELRNRERLTVKAAAEKLEWSEAKMWRIETGQTSLRSLDVEAMCRIYGAPADLTEALMGLAKETKARGWWHAYGDVIPEGFDVSVGLEEAASQLAWYESELVPGLLQTEDYARTLIEADNPGFDAEEISRRVHVRMARQPLVHRATGSTSAERRAQRGNPPSARGRPDRHVGATRPARRSVRAAERLSASGALQRRAAWGVVCRARSSSCGSRSTGTAGKANPPRYTWTASPRTSTWTNRTRSTATPRRSTASGPWHLTNPNHGLSYVKLRRS